MKRGRKSIFEKDCELLAIYDNRYYVDVETIKASYLPDEIDKMCQDLGITKKTLTELVSKGYKWATKSLWKMFTDDREPIRLI